MEKIKKLSREEKRIDRLAAIKNAAIEIFAENGYHAAKVSQIVAHVGVAQGTFYLYYEGKEAIFGEILSDFLTLLVTTIAKWEPGKLDAIEKVESELREIGLHLADVLIENRLLTKIYFREALGVAPEFDEMMREFYDALEGILTSFNRTLAEQGLIAPMNYQLISIQTIGMVERVIEDYVVNGIIVDTSPLEMVNHLLANFISGTRLAIPSEKT